MSNYTTIPNLNTNPKSYRGYQEGYNEIMSNRRNPFYNQTKGVYDSWDDMLKGTQWKNNQLSDLFSNYSSVINQNLSNYGSSQKSSNTSNTPDWMNFYRYEHPQYGNFANIMNRAFGSANQVESLNKQAVGNIIGDVNKARQYNNQDINLIGSLMSGNYLNQLREPLSQYKTDVSANISNLSSGLNNQRQSFADTIRSIISGEDTARTSALDELKNAYNNMLAEQRSDISQRESDTQRALANSAEVGIRKGMDELNAGMFKNRLPDTSYARQAMRIGSENQADVAKQMENLKWQNYNTLSSFERQLPQLYSGIQLQNIADIANQRQNAEFAISQMGRTDLSTIAGLQNALADALYKGDTSAIMSNQNLINSLIGSRTGLLQKQMQNELLPGQAAQQNALSQLAIAGSIGQTLPMYENIYSDFSNRFTPNTYYPYLPAPSYSAPSVPFLPQYNTGQWQSSNDIYNELINYLKQSNNVGINQNNKNVARPSVNSNPILLDAPGRPGNIWNQLFSNESMIA